MSGGWWGRVSRWLSHLGSAVSRRRPVRSGRAQVLGYGEALWQGGGEGGRRNQGGERGVVSVWCVPEARGRVAGGVRVGRGGGEGAAWK